MAYLLNEDNRMEPLPPENGRYFTVEELQEIVGGDFKIVDLESGEKAVISENQELWDKRLNTLASMMAGKSFTGNVLIVQDMEELR
jgi:hypothetical protein